jgi:hypothetical protein
MTREPDDALDVLRAVWSADGETSADLAEALPAQKVCRNMQTISFDGMAEPGADLREAWRERLQREGKLNTSGHSIRDLVLGADTPRS